MKKITKNNLIKFIQMKKDYLQNHDANLLKQINDFIDNVINKDKSYFGKISKMSFKSEDIKYLIY